MANARHLSDASDSRVMKRLFALCLLASPALVVTGCPMYEDGGCSSDYDCAPGYACHFPTGACVRPRSGGSGAATAGEGGSSTVTGGEGGAATAGAATAGEGGTATANAGDGGASAGNAGAGGDAAGAAGDVQGGAANETAAGAAG
jgi:hypothetical protein